jgi:hypothetical protein
MIFVIFAGALRRSLQDRLSKGVTDNIRDEIYLKLRTSTGSFIINTVYSCLIYA